MTFWSDEVTAQPGPDVARLAGWWRRVQYGWHCASRWVGAGMMGAARAVGG